MIARHLLRGSLWFGGALLAVVALVVGVMLFLWTEPGRRVLADVFADLAGGADQPVSIGQVEGRFPFETRLVDVRVGDRGGTWLDIAMIDAETRPLDLLRGELHFTRIAIREVRVDRLPRAIEAEEEQAGSLLPRFPLPVRVDDLRLSPVSVAEPVFGEPVALSIAGSAALGRTAREAQLSLSAERIDGTPGHARLLLAQDPAGANLTLEAEIEEPQGGILARAMQLPDRPPVSLRLAGEGPRDAWRGRIEASAGAAHLDATVALALDADVRLALDGTAAVVPLLPPRIAAQFPRPLAIDADLLWDPAGPVRIANLVLRDGPDEMRLAGEFVPDENRFSGSVEDRLRDGPLLRGLSPYGGAESVRITADGSGTLDRPSATADLEIAGLQAQGMAASRLAAHLEIRQADAGPGLALAAQGRIEGVTSDGRTLATALVGSSARWSLAGFLDPDTGDAALRAAEIASDRLTLTAAGQLTGRGTALEATVAGRMQEIAPVAALAGIEAAGVFTFDAHLSGNPQSRDLTAVVAADALDLATAEPVAAALLGPHVTAAGAVVTAGEGLTLDSVRIAGAGAALSMEGRIGPDLDVTFAVDLTRLDAIAGAAGASAGGALALAGTLSGSVESPALKARLSGRDVQIQGSEPARLDGTISAVDLLAAPNGAVALEIGLPDLTARVAGDFRLEEFDRLALRNLRLTGPGTAIGGDILLARGTGLAEGRLRGRVAELAPWGRLAGQPLRGAATLDLSLAAEAGGQAARLRLDGEDLALASKAEGGAVVGSLDLDARARDLRRDPDISASLSLADARLPGLGRMGQATMTVEGGLDQLSFEGQGAGMVEGTPERDFRIELAGAAMLGETGATLRLERLLANLGDLPVSLNAPVEIGRRGETLSLASLDAAIGAGRLTADGRMTADRIEAEAALAGFPLRTLAGFLGTGPALDGSLSGTLALRGDPGDPEGRAEIRLEGLRPDGGDTDGPAFAGVIRATLREGRLDVAADLGGAPGLDLDAEAAMPLGLDLAAMRLASSPEAPLSGGVRGTVDLGLVPRLVDLHGDVLDGRLAIDTAIGGTLAAPTLQGTASLAEGRYENADTGTVIESAAIDLSAERDRIVIRSLEANDGGDGRISGSGAVALDPAAGFPYEATVSLSNFALLRRSDARVHASGEVDLGPRDGDAVLTGRLVVESAELRVPDRRPPAIAHLDVVEVNLPPGQLAEAAPQTDEPGESPSVAADLPLALDLRVSIPARAFLRGRGLDAEFGGNLRIGGTIETPDIVGTLELIRGNLDFLGRSLDLQDGTIRFVGGGQVNPALDITAESAGEGFAARVHVGGTADAPSFALSSQPALPSDEILARLLFGESVGSLSPLQAVQLAQSAATLAGEGGPGDLMEKVRSKLGLDVLTVESGEGEAADSAVRVGRYIGDRVFVTTSQGLTPESRKVGVEIRVLPQVNVTSDIGPASGAEIGINWRYDY